MNVFKKIGGWFMNLIGRRSNIISRIERNHPNYYHGDNFFKNVIEVSKYRYMGYKDYNKVTMRVGGKITKDYYLKSINLAKVTCEKLTRLSFGEGTKMTTTSKDEKDKSMSEDFGEWITQNIDEDLFLDSLRDLTEKSYYAMGGMLITPYIKDSEIKFRYTEADFFVPLSWEYNEITEKLFISVHRKRKEEVMLLEYHEINDSGNLQIRYEIYVDKDKKGNFSVEGKVIDYFPNNVDMEFKGITEDISVYIKPAITNNIDFNSPLGISPYINSLDIMDIVNWNIDFWLNELKNGMKQIVIPESWLKKRVDPATDQTINYIDPTSTAHMPVNNNSDKAEAYDFTTVIRIEDIVKSINGLLSLYAVSTGVDASTYSFNAESGAITATEVISKRSDTFTFKRANEKPITRGIDKLFKNAYKLVEVHNTVKDAKKIELPKLDLKKININISFDDSVIVDDQKDREEMRTEVAEDLRTDWSYMTDPKGRGLSDAEAQAEIDYMEKAKEKAQKAFLGGIDITDPELANNDDDDTVDDE